MIGSVLDAMQRVRQVAETLQDLPLEEALRVLAGVNMAMQTANLLGLSYEQMLKQMAEAEREVAVRHANNPDTRGLTVQ